MSFWADPGLPPCAFDVRCGSGRVALSSFGDGWTTCELDYIFGAVLEIQL